MTSVGTKRALSMNLPVFVFVSSRVSLEFTDDGYVGSAGHRVQSCYKI